MAEKTRYYIAAVLPGAEPHLSVVHVFAGFDNPSEDDAQTHWRTIQAQVREQFGREAECVIFEDVTRALGFGDKISIWTPKGSG